MSLHLYTDHTPNGWKIELLLSELRILYSLHRIDIGKGDQFSEEFLKISPNNKIPAILDEDGPDNKPIAVFESGAILIYLTEKYESPLFPQQPVLKYQTLCWLMFQMSGIGPYLGQVYHFTKSAPKKIPYAIERYTKEAERLYSVLNKHLGSNKYLVGDLYTIADIACFPWILSHEENHPSLSKHPHLMRWYQSIEKRPATGKLISKISNLN